jgi:Tol biopolymer transport system component
METRQQLQPTLSPDRQHIAFSWDGDNGDNFDIYVKSTWGREMTRLTVDPGRDQSPAWSPNGQWIAFLRALPDLRQAVYLDSSRYFLVFAAASSASCFRAPLITSPSA